jgi:hypothetical protein
LSFVFFHTNSGYDTPFLEPLLFSLLYLLGGFAFHPFSLSKTLFHIPEIHDYILMYVKVCGCHCFNNGAELLLPQTSCA